jgi:hypothetical protein
MALCLTVGLLAVHGLRAGETVTISEAKRDDNGFLVHEVRSPYQAKITQIRVLLPDKVEKGQHYPVVYVLPVEAGAESRYGDGLKEVKQLDLHNTPGAVFVAPTFSHLPWYADHPTKPEVRQESYFLKVIVPFIDKTYPVRAEAGGSCSGLASPGGGRGRCCCAARTCSGKPPHGTPR